MPSSYSTDLRIELIANGEQSGTWGTTTNNNLGTLIEDAISATASVSVTTANQALTALNGAADQARCAYIVLTTTTTANFAVYVPPTAQKLYAVYNNSSYIATVYCSTVIGNTTAAGTGIAIPAGSKVLLRSDGTNITEQMNQVVGDFSVGGTLAVDNTLGVYRNLNVYGNSDLDGYVTTLSPLTTTSSAYLNGTTPKTVTISVASPGVVSCSTASFVDDTAVVLSTTGALPTGLSENTTYYVVGTNIASVFDGLGSISGTTLTITSVYTGSIGIGTAITGANISAGTSVTGLISGAGSTGTYTINNSQTVASDTIRGTYSGAQTFKLATSMGGTAINTSGTQSGTHTATPVSLANTPPAGTSGNQIATTEFVANSAINIRVLQAVAAATTSNITLSGAQTIDGVAVVAGDRVLVKDQLTSSQTVTFNTSTDVITAGSGTAPSNDSKVMFTTTGALATGLTVGRIYYVIDSSGATFKVSLTQDGAAVTLSGTPSGTNTVGTVPSATNGIYEVNSSTWTRATDANSSAEVAAAQVAVVEGTVNGGKRFVTNFDVDNTIGSSTMQWNEVINGPANASTLGGIRLTVSGTTLNLFTY